jgi:hypothetical protein
MGNEISVSEDVEGVLPPLIFKVEQLLWPGIGEVACEVCLQNSPAGGRNIVIGQVSSSKPMALQPMLVRSAGVQAILSMAFYDARPGKENGDGGAGKLLTSVVLPFQSLLRLGLPLYTSIWLGLKLNELDTSFEVALSRSRVPNSPKVRVTMFKPCPGSYTDMDGVTISGRPKELEDARGDMTERTKDMWDCTPRPDLGGAFREFVETFDQGGGCTGRDEHHRISLVQQVKMLIDSLRLSNDSYALLQSAMFGQDIQEMQTAKIRIRFEEAFWDTIPDASCVCKCGRSGGEYFQRIDGSYMECTNYRIGEPLLISVRRSDLTVLAEQSLECSEFYQTGFSGTIELLAPVPGLPQGQQATAKMIISIVDNNVRKKDKTVEDRKISQQQAQALESLRLEKEQCAVQVQALDGQLKEQSQVLQSLRAERDQLRAQRDQCGRELEALKAAESTRVDPAKSNSKDTVEALQRCSAERDQLVGQL